MDVWALRVAPKVPRSCEETSRSPLEWWGPRWAAKGNYLLSTPTIQAAGSYSLPLTLTVPWSTSSRRRRRDGEVGQELPAGMAPTCPTAQRQLQGQHSRKPEQLCPSLPEGPHVSTPSTFWDVGSTTWAAPITEQSTPKPTCVFLWGQTGAGQEAELSTQQVLRKWREPPVCVPQPQHVPSTGISHPTWRGVDHRYPQLRDR